MSNWDRIEYPVLGTGEVFPFVSVEIISFHYTRTSVNNESEYEEQVSIESSYYAEKNYVIYTSKLWH